MKTYAQLQNVESILSPSRHLNPRLWNNDESLNGTIRNQIIDRARLYVDKLGLSENSIEDLRIVGGSASYNWSDTSDIDCTIMISRDEGLDKNEIRKIGRDSTYLTYKLSPKIEGLDLNFYISSRNVGGLRPANQSVYSIFKNEWILGPTAYEESSPNYITSKAMDIIEQIESCADDSDSDANPCAENLLAKLKRYRTSGLKSKDGEFSQPNIVWRLLSRSGYINLLKDKIHQLEVDAERLKKPGEHTSILSNQDYKELIYGQKDPINRVSYALSKWNKRLLLGEPIDPLIRRLKPIVDLFNV